jgi:hypothetical protein
MMSDPKFAERKDDIWSFLEKNIRERKGETLPGCIRMPHVYHQFFFTSCFT